MMYCALGTSKGPSVRSTRFRSVENPNLTQKASSPNTPKPSGGHIRSQNPINPGSPGLRGGSWLLKTPIITVLTVTIVRVTTSSLQPANLGGAAPESCRR